MNLSPGLYHKLVPKDKLANLQWRVRALKALAKDTSAQRGFIEMCRRDLLFFVNAFLWQYNPRKKGHEVEPFISWDFQDEAFLVMLECIAIDEDLCIKKSREMGASWMCLIVTLWLYLFHGWQKFLAISRSADAVDAPDDPDSLFWKIDFMLEYLPAWLVGDNNRRRMGFRNHANNSTITGQASTGKAGVGGRATMMFVDEFSQIVEDFQVLHRTADTTGCRIFNFTYTDVNNAAFEIGERCDMRQLVMHWSQHPDKNKGLYRYDPDTNTVDVLDKSFEYAHDFKFVMDGAPTGGPFPGLRSPWYDRECIRRASSRAIAMDLDIDPRGSMSQFFDKLVIRRLQLTYACDPYWTGDLDYDIDTGRPVRLIQREGGPIRLWCHPDTDGRPPKGKYAGGADLSTGSGATNSCISFVNAHTGEKVLEYCNPFITPDRLAPLAVALCLLFKADDGDTCLFAWEQQGPGLKFGSTVTDLGYRRIYYKSNEFELNSETSEKPGWYPAPANKRLLLEDYRSALASTQFLNRSWEALDETMAFRYGKGGKVEHGGEQGGDDPSGANANHGDRVIADGLAWKMAKSIGRLGYVKPEDEVKIGSLAWRRQLHETAVRQRDEWTR